MTDTFWIDANVLLRYLTKDPPEMAERALGLTRRAEQGQVIIKLSVLVLAETCWVLQSFYEYDRARIADVLSAFVRASGVEAEEGDAVLEALSHYRDKNVDFVDAFLAAHARSAGPARICTFDVKHFHRLDVEVVSP